MDLREIASALRHGWHWIVGGAAGGLLLAALVVTLAPPRYQSEVTILLRSFTDGPTARLAGASGDGELSLGGLADMLSVGSGFKTEMEILTSRSVVGAVVDSLGLQSRVVSPKGVPNEAVFAAAHFAPDLRERLVFRFERDGSGYTVRGPGGAGRAEPGVPFPMAGGAVTLRSDGVPDAFRVEVVSREATIRRVQRALRSRQTGGDIAELVFRAGDPETAASVPNAMVAQYLHRRKTSDRGVNQHRFEFLAAHTDSIAVALRESETRLRAFQEQSGVLDPELSGETELRRAVQLRGVLEEQDAEAQGLQRILADPRHSARDLAAYPTLLRNGAVNHLLARLLDAEARRTELLDRRTPRDPDVLVLNETIRQLEGEIGTISSAYLDGLNRQRAELRVELGRYDRTLSALPSHAEQILRLQREVRRLSETSVALQTQLVQLRLAAMAEGGDVRQIDVAEPPLRPRFPSLPVVLVGGLLGGVFFGMAGAVGTATLRRRIRYTWEVEQATGVAAAHLSPDRPLVLGDHPAMRSVLVVPLGRGARAATVAARLAGTAALRGEQPVMADLENPAPTAALPGPGEMAEAATAADGGSTALRHVDGGDGGAFLLSPIHRNGGGVAGVRAAVQELEQRFAPVIVALPSDSNATTVALLSRTRGAVLVIREGEVSRTELKRAVASLGRSGVETVGVVLEPARGGRDAS